MPGKTDYSERGWNHPEFASLLYPMATHDHLNPEEIACVFFKYFVFVFLTNPLARQIVYEIEHGIQTISENEWPAFLYPRGTNPDVEDDQEGLFRGYLLPRVSFISFVYQSEILMSS